MSALASWQSQLSQAIVDFPLWGRLRPSTSRGHAITALAFHRWSKGGLGLVVFESDTKSMGSMLYACTLGNEGSVFAIDWKEGWCSDHHQSNQRFTEDAGRGKTVYSYSTGKLTQAGTEEAYAALNSSDRLLVEALRLHLDQQLGAFNWTLWGDAFYSSKPSSRSGDTIALVNPVHLESGQYVLAMWNPFQEDSGWPSGLTGNELCRYLGSTSRARASWKLDFFAFQEKLELYQKSNPCCVWTKTHSHELLGHLKGQHNMLPDAASFFRIGSCQDNARTAATRVVAPCFSPYAPSLVEAMRYEDKEQADAAWFAVSHFLPVASRSGSKDAFDFSMFSKSFQGKKALDGSEELALGDFIARAHGKRGERGTLVALDGPSSPHFSVTDALRQLRAYFGGILAVEEPLVAQDPLFWKARFDEQEVAALLGSDDKPVHAHRHFFYDKKPLDFQYTMDMRESLVQAQYSLYQAEPWKWRALQSASLNADWGWKVCLDSLKTKHTLVFPSRNSGNVYDDINVWETMLGEWLNTMGPLDAMRVFSVLKDHASWPIRKADYKQLAVHYLSDEPSLWALCEMMDFDPDGVLLALQQREVGYRTAAAYEVSSKEMSALLGDTP